MSFGSRLREVRKLRGMSQQELADELKISINSVANYERGTSFPKESLITDIIRFFGLDPNFLFQDSTDVKTSRWYEERFLLDSFRELDRDSRYFVNSIIARESERNMSFGIAGHSVKNRMLTLELNNGVYGKLRYSNEREKIRYSYTTTGVDFIMLVKGNALEPLIFDGNALGIKYVPDVNEKQWGVYDIDGFTIIAVRMGDSLVSPDNRIINTALLTRPPMLYGRVVKILREKK